MIAIDRGALPKRIAQGDAGVLAGESAYWYCDRCHQWRTTEIKADGIFCPVCGQAPDWAKRPPTLAYGSRYRRVADLCAIGSPWRAEYDAAEENYGNFIDQVDAGLPLQAQKAGWLYFHNIWRTVDGLADYLLTAPDAPETDGIVAYTERGLQRRYFDPRRRVNTSSLSDLAFPNQDDEYGVPYSAQEQAEVASFHAVDNRPFYDTYFNNGFLRDIPDPLERSIARDLSAGETKRGIERLYGLSERQVRTIVKHLAKSLKEMLNVC